MGNNVLGGIETLKLERVERGKINLPIISKIFPNLKKLILLDLELGSSALSFDKLEVLEFKNIKNFDYEQFLEKNRKNLPKLIKFIYS